MKKHKALKIVLISIGAVFALVISFIGGVLIFASATTLKVKDAEKMQVNSTVQLEVEKSNQIKLLTWNTGYGALDERQDCCWDGGKGVYGESKEVVQENIDALKSKINELDPDIFFVQELDLDSKRSYFIDELGSFRTTFDEKYNNSFACNFKAGLVPLPLSQMTGKVNAGIATFSKFSINDSERVQLPIPFSWPMKLFNLKRCLLVTRMPIKDSDKELVMINLHLEAYSSEEGKAKQANQLMGLMKEEYEKGNYVIAGGDFNQTFSHISFNKYPNNGDWECPTFEESSYIDSFTFEMDDSYPTCRSLKTPLVGYDKSTFQYYMIDGFIVSNNVTVDEIHTVDLGFKNTDHNPVAMNIKLS